MKFEDYELIATKEGYEIFKEVPGKPFNLNIVGIRNPLGFQDEFNDKICVYFQERGLWVSYIWPATTIPGSPWLKSPVNSKGTAVLCPGQYRSSHRLGIYHGYTALKQVGPLKVWRDNDRNSSVDVLNAKVETGFFGIHIHRAGILTKLIGYSSAGCQVFQKRSDFAEFIDLCEAAAAYWNSSFSYTLVES